ncbi:MAG: deoxyribonuclease V [Wenzhouxiangella sp.]
MNAGELIQRQRILASRVITSDPLPERLTTVAGVDVAFPNGGRTTRAAAVLMRFPDLVVIDEVVVEQATVLPYIPGLLSFRELPAILSALARLPRPDLVLCDGQGLAHPRRFGVACHLGVETGLPAIGVGKSRLCGQHEEPALARGASSALMDKGEPIGTVLRTRQGVRPVYVSIGHKIDLDRACELVLACAPRFRLPEPIRRADRLAGAR